MRQVGAHHHEVAGFESRRVRTHIAQPGRAANQVDFELRVIVPARVVERVIVAKDQEVPVERGGDDFSQWPGVHDGVLHKSRNQKRIVIAKHAFDP